MIRKIIKRILKPIVDNLHHRLNRNEHLEGDYFCPVCENSVKYFRRLPDSIFEELDKYQYIHSSFYTETINLLKYSCPQCNASDRDRLYALFINEKLSGVSNNQITFLDIAPSRSLAKFIQKKGVQYRSADLYNERVDDKVDVTEMKIYENSRFDIFICSHVLEHVKKDIQALHELYRVLKPNGWGIIMVPILLSLEEDLEEDSFQSEADHWKYYGQNDHVRMYSKRGFVNKLNGAGFKVTEYGQSHFGEILFEKTGIHKRSILYVVQKGDDKRI